MASFAPAPPPQSALARYRPLAPNASVRVSPLCLGTMNFGTTWTPVMGEMTRATANEIMDFYFEAGGNFIDTSGNYQDEESETWIGEWMATRQNRDQIVLATKYTTNFSAHHGFKGRVNAAMSGSNVKAMHTGVETSLKKLQTSYIDILYVHWYDHVTSVEELMPALNSLLLQGKVLYLGASDMPAFFVSKCNQWARDHGQRGFAVYQGNWNAASRDFEADVMHMCQMEGMGMAPFGALGSGQFKTHAQREALDKEGEQGRRSLRPNPRAAAVTDALEKVARRHGLGDQVTSIALQYVMHKTPYVFPIVGGRKISHLRGNIEALHIELTDEDMREIEDATDWTPPFPWSMTGFRPEGNFLMVNTGHYDYVQELKPIRSAPKPEAEEDEKK